MARSSLPLLLLPLCLLPFFFALSLSADANYCASLQTGLATCFAYVGSSSTAPPSSACCNALKPTLSPANLTNTIACLCELGTTNSSLQQKALQLPKSCNINATIPTSPCSANSSTGSSSSPKSAGVLSALGPSYAAVTFTSLLSSVLAGGLLI